MNSKPLIGIVGGMGPYAGLDLAKKVFDQTIATRDQEHLPLVLVSAPEEIEDRTLFVTGKSNRNPADSIFPVITMLAQAGATVAGIPCNTAHAPQIISPLVAKINEAGYQVKLLHMIKEVGRFVRESFAHVKTIGLLSTTGTYHTRIYPMVLEPLGVNIVAPDQHVQESLVHDAIYNPAYGIKAQSNPVTTRARGQLLEGIMHLRGKGVEAVILGCTEIPLAIPEGEEEGIQLIDPTIVLARALIRETFPHKLRPLSNFAKST
ncbi:MAG: aspartate/glutamate racemase family protein [Ignavibacteria bacterium]|nr:aspartate/glutamate racemase family protein [Ignavibacteria bacterium]